MSRTASVPVVPAPTPESEWITLSKAAALIPSRPSTNCVWRWCRRGVRSRGGDRIRMQHVRFGGRVFTTAAWVMEFGRLLAESDAAYFDARDEAGRALSPRDLAYAPPSRQVVVRRESEKARARRLAAIEAELEAEGL